MAQNIGSMYSTLALDATNFNRGISRAQSNLRSSSTKMNKSLAQLERRWNEVTRAAKGYAKQAFNLQNAIGALAGSAGLGLLVQRSMQSTQQLQRQAEMAGTTVKEFEKLTYAANQLGLSQSNVRDGLKELRIRLNEFSRTGAGPARDALEHLNISQQQAGKLAQHTSKAVMFFIDRLHDMDKASQMDLGDQIFGGQGSEAFISMIQAGTKAVKSYGKEAEALGITLDREIVKKNEKAYQAIKTLSDQLQTSFIKILGNVHPLLEDAASNMGDWVAQNQKFLNQDVPKHIENIGESLGDIKSIYDKLPEGVVGAAGAGIAGRIIFGSWGPAKFVSATVLINEQLKTLEKRANIDMPNLGDISESYKGSVEAFQNIFDVLTGKRDWQTGAMRVTKEITDNVRTANGVIEAGTGKVIDYTEATQDNTKAKEKNAEATKKQAQSIDQMLKSMKPANDLFGDIQFKAYGGDGGSLLPQGQLDAMTRGVNNTLEQIRQARDEFFFKGDGLLGLDVKDFESQGEKSGKEMGEALSRTLQVTLQTQADSIEDFFSNIFDSVGQMAGTRIAEGIGKQIGGIGGGIVGGVAGSAAGSLISLAYEGIQNADFGRETYQASVRSGATVSEFGELSESITKSKDVLSDFKDENTGLLESMNSNLQRVSMGIEQTVAGIAQQTQEFGGLGEGQVGPGFGRQYGGEMGAGIAGSMAIGALGGFLGAPLAYKGAMELGESLGGIAENFTNFVDDLAGDLASNITGGDKSVKKRGIQIGRGNTTLGELRPGRGGDIGVRAFAKIKEESGALPSWAGGSSGGTSTKFGELDRQVANGLNTVFENVSSTLLEQGKALGADMEEVLSFTFDPKKLNLKDLSAKKKREKIQSYISKQMNVATEELFTDVIGKYQKVDEEISTTATRIIRTKQVFVNAFEDMEISLGNSAQDIVETSQQLKQAFGSVQKGQQLLSGFYEAFAPENLKTKNVKEDVQGLFDDLNRQIPDTKKGLIDVAQSFKLDTEQGQKNIAMLTSHTSQLKDFYGAMEEGSKSIQQSITGFDKLQRKIRNFFRDPDKPAVEVEQFRKQYLGQDFDLFAKKREKLKNRKQDYTIRAFFASRYGEGGEIYRKKAQKVEQQLQKIKGKGILDFDSTKEAAKWFMGADPEQIKKLGQKMGYEENILEKVQSDFAPTIDHMINKEQELANARKDSIQTIQDMIDEFKSGGKHSTIETVAGYKQRYQGIWKDIAGAENAKERREAINELQSFKDPYIEFMEARGGKTGEYETVEGRVGAQIERLLTKMENGEGLFKIEIDGEPIKFELKKILTEDEEAREKTREA